MNSKLLEILACPKCRADLKLTSESELTCGACESSYPVTNGIPRFVDAENYASSFGYQWNLFRKEQIDSHNGTTLSADRFWNETGWKQGDLDRKWVLDAGCGAGRFLDVLAGTRANVVGVDISSAIDAAKENLAGRGNVHFVQASIYELPFREGTFDYVYSIGVIQHTPEPDKSLRAVGRMVKPGGEIAVTIYPRKPWTKLYSKYWWRPVTKRMGKANLLNTIRGVMPVAFAVTNVLFRIPLLRRFFIFVIPIANYVHEKQLSRDQRYQWAVLDTFDMLSPEFDQPMTEDEVSEALRRAGIGDLRGRSGAGVNLTGRKAASA
jgi:SAM-dependent methyltransferase